MKNFQMSKILVFTGVDWKRPRWTVEQEKLNQTFPKFKIYGISGDISSIQGTIKTRSGNSYYVKIKVSSDYPHKLPRIELPYTTIDSDCEHVYQNGNICIMKPEQWSSILSIASVIQKTAVWLNKYDLWIKDGKRKWPGKDQHR